MQFYFITLNENWELKENVQQDFVEIFYLTIFYFYLRKIILKFVNVNTHKTICCKYIMFVRPPVFEFECLSILQVHSILSCPVPLYLVQLWETLDMMITMTHTCMHVHMYGHALRNTSYKEMK